MRRPEPPDLSLLRRAAASLPFALAPFAGAAQEGPVVMSDAPAIALPEEVPEQFSGGLPIVSAVALVLLCAVLLIFVWEKARRKRRMLRQRITGLANGPRFRAVDAMLHAAWKSGRIDEERLRRAHGIARDMTEMEFTMPQMREAASRTDRLILPTNFLWMREGVGTEEKLVIFNATVSVLLADGPLSRMDRGFLRALTRGLGLRSRDLRDLRHLVRL